MSSRIGLSSFSARSNAASPHSIQSTGWWIAERRWADAALASRLVRPSPVSFAKFTCSTLAVWPPLSVSSIRPACPRAHIEFLQNFADLLKSLVISADSPIPHKFHQPPREGSCVPSHVVDLSIFAAPKTGNQHPV